jgi:hypothetical protein
VELLGKGRDRSVCPPELLQNAASGGVRERAERDIEAGLAPSTSSKKPSCRLKPSLTRPTPYADQFVTFGINDLTDFFGCFTQACQNPFQPITLVPSSSCSQSTCTSNQCDAICFINYKGKHLDPDDE